MSVVYKWEILLFIYTFIKLVLTLWSSEWEICIKKTAEIELGYLLTNLWHGVKLKITGID